MHTTRSGMTPKAIEELIAQRVAEALANYEANRNNRNLIESGDENDDGNEVVMEVKTVMEMVMEVETVMEMVMEVETVMGTEMEMEEEMETGMGTEGAVGLARWFEKMESVYHISNCEENCQVKYATCTLLDSALTWWNSHVKTVGIDAAYAMTWKELMKMMTEVPNEEEKIERYIWGLPDNIQGNMTSAGTRLQDTIRMANSCLMDLKGNGAIYTKMCDQQKKVAEISMQEFICQTTKQKARSG
ncbi:hypothetical protein Tco_0673067 [Tanacetum coccineum]